jgi:hypothetical protein
MIRYSLNCAGGHSFDAWFRSSGDYDAQAKGGLLACPVCGAHEVGKALMTPSVAIPEQAKPAEAVLLGDNEHKLRGMLRAVRNEVTKNAENVGARFADVARQMHDGEIEKTSVYGVASADEVRSLAEDGIEFHPLPPLPDEGN